MALQVHGTGPIGVVKRVSIASFSRSIKCLVHQSVSESITQVMWRTVFLDNNPVVNMVVQAHKTCVQNDHLHTG